MGFLKPSQPQIVPVPTPAQSLTGNIQPTQAPIPGSTASAASRPTSFLASAALPPPTQANSGGKTLLGQ